MPVIIHSREAAADTMEILKKYGKTRGVIHCYSYAREQAEEYGHSELREFAFLITHSMLHLFGYDHMEPEEAKVMEDKQRQILDELSITR